jgi:hypothetical protein
MEEIIDYLTERIRETRIFRRVVGRSERERLLSRKARTRSSPDYEEEQLGLAALLPVQVAVLGWFS